MYLDQVLHFNINTVLCAQLWNSAVIDASGNAAICCEIGKILSDMHIAEYSIFDFQRHQYIEQMRQKMLSGEKLNECDNCFNAERNGVKSLRQHLNEGYVKYHGGNFPLELNVENLEIRFGNLCQLECAMCHPSRSKKFENVVNFVKSKDNTLYHSHENHFVFDVSAFNSAWCEDDAVFVKIVNQCSKVTRLFLNGGEPLLSKSHNLFLQKLIDAGFAKNIVLVYSTNFLLGKNEHFELWKQFKNVSLTLSLDDLYDRNKFIRYPSDWEKIQKALDFFYHTSKNHANVQIRIWQTVNVLNFAYILDFFEFFNSKYPDLDVEFRSIQQPSFLDPANLPMGVKEIIVKRLIAFFEKNPSYKVQGIPRALHILNSNCDLSKLKDGLKYFEIYGEHRAMNEKKLFKRTFDLLDIYKYEL